MDCSIAKSASHGWRGICLGKDLLKPKLGKIIGNGASTSLWAELWLSLDVPKCPMGHVVSGHMDLKVSHLLHDDSLHWNREKIQNIIPQYENEILLIKPSKKGTTDKWAWLPNTSGMYSAKSGYYEALKQDLNQPEEVLSSADFNRKTHIWASKSSPKTKILLWKAMQNALPVGENLKHRGIAIEAQCPHCGKDETVEYLFFTCDFASQVWHLVPFKSPLLAEQITCLKTGIELAKRMICLPPTGLGEVSFFPWIFWSIWTTRNQIIFRDKHLEPIDTFHQAITQAKEWQSAQLSKPNPRLPLAAKTRIQSGFGTMRCNTDAAWKDDKAGCGWVFSNPMGEVIQLGSKAAKFVRSPLMAEAVAVLFAVQKALELGLTNLLIASDSAILIKAINSELRPMELHGILYDILELSLNFSSISFNFVPREANRVADSLAKESLVLLCTEP